MARSINIAVIGCGQMGMHHARVYKNLPGVNLAAICEPAETRRAAAANELGCEGYQDMGVMYAAHPEIDGVSIATPDNLHLAAVEAAVRNNKHILLEKPIASSLEEGKYIAGLAEKSGNVFAVGHLLRFDPRYYGLKHALDRGRLGDAVHISLRRNSPIIGPRRYIGQSDLSMHVMIHDIDIVNWLLRGRAVKVFAKARSVRLKEHGMNDVIYAIVTYDSGVIVSMEASWVLPENSPTIIDDQMQVVGTKGVAYIDSCDRGLRFTTESCGSEYPDTRHWPYVGGSPGGDLYAEISAFVGAVYACEAQRRQTTIPDGRPACHGDASQLLFTAREACDAPRLLCTAQEACDALAVVDAIERSISTGAEVSIPPAESTILSPQHNCQ